MHLWLFVFFFPPEMLDFIEYEGLSDHLCLSAHTYFNVIGI